MEPNEVSRQVVDARLSKSTCLGLAVRSTKVCQPLSLGPALLLIFAVTLVMVTQAFEKDPLGAAQVGGSLMLVVTVPVVEGAVDVVPELPPPQLTQTARAIITAINNTREE